MNLPLHNGTLSSTSSSRRSSLSPYSGGGKVSSSSSGVLLSESTLPRSTWSTGHHHKVSIPNTPLTATSAATATCASTSTCTPTPSSSAAVLLSSSSSPTSASVERWKNRLITRARVTNLGVLLLVSLTSFSVLLNLIQLNQHRSTWMTDHSYHRSIKSLENSQSFILTPPPPPAPPAPPKVKKITPSKTTSTSTSTSAINSPLTFFNLSNLDHLILVPCHAVYVGTDASKAYDDSEWMLEWYQRDQNSAKAWIVHIQQGIEELVKDEHSLLIYSGGQTKSSQLPFPLSESTSYAKLAHSLNLYSKTKQTLLDQKNSVSGSSSHFQQHEEQDHQHYVNDVNDVNDVSPSAASLLSRVTTEEFSLDSFQNVLFSLARFREMTGRYPRKITMTGYSFKTHRLLQLHIPALKIQPDMFHYFGYDGDEMIDERYKGERKVVETFERDKYGCQQAIQVKRRSRNSSHRVHGYLWSAPEMRGLLEWCPTDGVSLYPGKVPW